MDVKELGAGGFSSYETIPKKNSNSINKGFLEMVKEKIDQEDEGAAMKETLALMKMLISGKIDYSALKNSDTNPEVTDGPNRSSLELLKTIIRRILIAKGAGVDKNANGPSSKGNMDDISLKDLCDRLPEGLRGLLKKAFPDLEEIILEDLRKLEKSNAEQSLKQKYPDSLSFINSPPELRPKVPSTGGLEGQEDAAPVKSPLRPDKSANSSYETA